VDGKSLFIRKRKTKYNRNTVEINRAYQLGEITVSIPITISLTRGNTVEINRT
jgi:hypothetical protein